MARDDYMAAAEEEERPSFAQIPTSFGHELRACLRCRLIKTYDQFRESGCENCPFLDMEKEHDNVVSCTTPNFTGIISVMDPSRSWAAKWLRIGKFIPGCYTLAVSEELPEEYQTLLTVILSSVLPENSIVMGVVRSLIRAGSSDSLPAKNICTENNVQYVAPKRT